MKNHQRRIRRLFALLLAAMLAVEPAGAMPAVYAAEDGAEIGAMSEEDSGSLYYGQANEVKDPKDAETNGEADPEASGSDGIEEDERDGAEQEVPGTDSVEDGENGNTGSEIPGNGEEKPETESGRSGR